MIRALKWVLLYYLIFWVDRDQAAHCYYRALTTVMVLLENDVYISDWLV